MSLRKVRFFQALQIRKVFIGANKGKLAIHKNTLVKFYTSNIERFENGIEGLSNENRLLKQELNSFKTGADFQNKWSEEAKRDLEVMRAIDPMEEDIKLIEQKHQQFEEKI